MGEADLPVQSPVTSSIRWLPLGEAAFSRARETDRPLFVWLAEASDGWRATEAVTARLEAQTVCVRVDPREDPAADRALAAFVEAFQGSFCGHPATVWLTPSGTPWLAGHDYPPRPDVGLIDLGVMLDAALGTWRRWPEAAEALGVALLSRLRPAPRVRPAAAFLRDFEAACGQWFQGDGGGLGGAPGFPLPECLAALQALGSETALQMVNHTLCCVERGEIARGPGGAMWRSSRGRSWDQPDGIVDLVATARLAPVIAETARRTRNPTLAAWAERLVGALDQAPVSGATRYYAASALASTRGARAQELVAGGPPPRTLEEHAARVHACLDVDAVREERQWRDRAAKHAEAMHEALWDPHAETYRFEDERPGVPRWFHERVHSGTRSSRAEAALAVWRLGIAQREARWVDVARVVAAEVARPGVEPVHAAAAAARVVATLAAQEDLVPEEARREQERVRPAVSRRALFRGLLDLEPTSAARPAEDQPRAQAPRPTKRHPDVAVVGTGPLGRALATGWGRAGLNVALLSRAPEGRASEGLHNGAPYAVRDYLAARKAGVVVLAIPYAALDDVVAALPSLGARLVIDPMNPWRVDQPGLAVPPGTSVAEQVLARLPRARLVKAFNAVFAADVLAPRAAWYTTALVCGDHRGSKRRVQELGALLDLAMVDAGGLEMAPLLEAAAFRRASRVAPRAGLRLVL